MFTPSIWTLIATLGSHFVFKILNVYLFRVFILFLDVLWVCFIFHWYTHFFYVCNAAHSDRWQVSNCQMRLMNVNKQKRAPYIQELFNMLEHHECCGERSIYRKFRERDESLIWPQSELLLKRKKAKRNSIIFKYSNIFKYFTIKFYGEQMSLVR